MNTFTIVPPAPASAASSFTIVDVAVAVPSCVPAGGLDRVTVKPSLASDTESPATFTVKVALEVFAAIVTVPLGSAPPKSAASARLAPEPVTAQFTVVASEARLLRLTVKV